MRIVRCERCGNFYDAEKYPSCSYCAGGDTAGMEDHDVTFALGAGSSKDMESDDRTMRGDTFGASYLDERQTGGTSAPPPYPDTVSYIEPWDDDNDMTVSTSRKRGSMAIEPVVGWLICIKGKHIGQDYRLRAGKNYVGRSDRMDVVLKGEGTVSRDRHVILLFEPKQSIFLVQPGESRELAYLNDELLLQPQVLKQGDIVTVGEVDLMFVPLCSADGFRWAKFMQ